MDGIILSKRDAVQLYGHGFEIGFTPKGTALTVFKRHSLHGMALPGPAQHFIDALDGVRDLAGAKPKSAASYVAQHARLTLHFEFADGSNPFVFYGTPSETLAQLRKWHRNWDMTCIKNDGRMLFARLSEKSHGGAPDIGETI